MRNIHAHTPTGDDTVVGTVDAAGPTEEFVIADISADDAWLTMAADAAPSLPSWR